MDSNYWHISGNLTHDCEERILNDGTSVISFSVAVNDRVNRDGNWEDRPNYFDCVVFARTEKARNYYVHSLLKGAGVDVEGKGRWSSWEKDGQRRSKVELSATNVKLMRPPKQAQPQPRPTDDDDCPF